MFCIRIWAFAASRMLSFMTILFLSVTGGYCAFAGYWKSGQPIKYCSHSCTGHASHPLYMAENILNRQFHAAAPEEKRLPDAAELRWQEGSETHRICLRAILLDLQDRRIVADKISGRNDHSPVFRPLMRLQRQIRVHIPCFTVAEDSSIQAEHSMPDWRRQVWFRACPGQDTAWTMGRWKDSGESGSGKTAMGDVCRQRRSGKDD